MAKQLDEILVIDLESTCWEGDPPPDQMSEIIEIGICPIDVQSMKRPEKRSILVKPEKSQISEFCTSLTTLTPDMFEQAGTLRDAVAILKRDYHSKERLWASWGDYDRRQFERVCRHFEVGYPFGPSHLNVKTLFATSIGHPHELGLDGAYHILGEQLEGTHHRGDDDAWNIAGVLCRMLRKLRGEPLATEANSPPGP